MYVDRISMELTILYFKVSEKKFQNYDAFLFLKIVLSWQTVQTLMKCCLMHHFIRVCTVCKSTGLLVSRMKWVKDYETQVSF